MQAWNENNKTFDQIFDFFQKKKQITKYQKTRLVAQINMALGKNEKSQKSNYIPYLQI